MSEILKTNDYSIFKKHENNREIDKKNMHKIMFSIQSLNMLQFRPILVDENMCVIDGQHRLEAAKALGLDVYYQIKQEAHSEDILLLNVNQKPWKTEEYVNYYASKGNENYIKFVAFSKKIGTPIEKVTRFLKGSREDRCTELKCGRLQYFTEEREKEILDLMKKTNEIKELLKLYIIPSPRFLNNGTLSNSLIAFLQNPDVNFDTFKTKIVLKSQSIKKCSDRIAYLSMFRDIYNYRNHNPIE